MRLVKILVDLCRLWAGAGMVLLFLVIGLVSLNALLDLFFNHSFNGLDELLVQLVGVAIGMTLPYAEQQKAHLIVDLLCQNFSLAWKRKINYFANFLLAIMLMLIFYYTFLGFLQVKQDALSTSTLGLTVWYFYVPLLVSLFLWLALVLHSLFYPQHLDQQSN